MNKKQLIVIWGTIIGILIFAVARIATLNFMDFTDIKNMTGFFLISFIVALIAGFAAYILRNK